MTVLVINLISPLINNKHFQFNKYFSNYGHDHRPLFFHFGNLATHRQTWMDSERKYTLTLYVGIQLYIKIPKISTFCPPTFHKVGFPSTKRIVPFAPLFW